MARDNISKATARRPSVSELVESHILPDNLDKVSPAIAGVAKDLERNQLQDQLRQQLSKRPEVDDVEQLHILPSIL
jgi:hypothetical protein